MAIELVGQVHQAVTTTTVSLTSLTGGIASQPAQGDVIIATIHTGAASDLNSPTIRDAGAVDYTEIANLYADDTNDANQETTYKVVGSTPDTSISFAMGSAEAGYATVSVWRGVDTSNVLDVALVTASGANSTAVNPASITPVTAGAVILAIGTAAHNNGGGSFSSSDLSNFISGASTSAGRDVYAGLGSAAWTSGAFDPAAWTGAPTTAADSWVCATLALRPSITTLSPSLLTNDQTFYGPTITTTVGLAPSLLTNAQTFHAPTITATVGLAPSLLTNSQTFYSPTVAIEGMLTPSLLTNAQTFHAPTITATYSLAPSRLNNTQTFYAPTITATYTLAAPLLSNVAAFYGPAVAHVVPVVIADEDWVRFTPDRFIDRMVSFEADRFADRIVSL